MHIRYSYIHTGILIIFCAMLGLARPAAAQSWVKLSPPVTSPLPNLFAVHFLTASEGYVGGERSGGGVLYKTTNAGTSWSVVSLPGSTDSINDIHFPSSAVGVVVGTQSYVAVSIDGGNSWLQRSVPTSVWPSGGNINGVYFKDANIGFVVGSARTGSGTRMARTTNGGVTWIDVPMTGPLNNFYDIDFFDADRGVVVGTGNPPRKSSSSDGGVTWQTNGTMGPGVPPSLSFYGVDGADGTTIGYASGGMVVGTNYPEVRKTTDRGATWAQLANQPSGNRALSGVIAISDKMVIVSGNDGTAHRTIDGGLSWQPETLTPTTSYDLRRISRAPDHRLYMVGLGGTIYRLQLVANARFLQSSLDFSTFCPTGRGRKNIQINNDGGAPLIIDSVVIAPPTQSSVTYSVVSFPDTIHPGAWGEIWIEAYAVAGALPGAYAGSLRVYNSDENYAGSDRDKQISLVTTVVSHTLAVDATVPTDAGATRIGFDKVLALPNLFASTGSCAVRPLSIRLARGTDFRITPPIPVEFPTDRKVGLNLLFNPTGPCERYDTIIVEHDGTSPPSPIRIPIVGTGLVRSFGTQPPDTLHFGGVLVNIGVNEDLKLENRGYPTECLEKTDVISFRIAGPNAADFTTSFSISPGQRLPILPGDELPVTITARPAAEGERIAYAIIGSDARVEPDTVVLIANGLRPELTPASPEIRFPLTDLGGRVDSTVQNFIVNLGSAAADITGVAITGAQAGDFRYNGPAPTITIPVNGRQTIMVSFIPTGAGLRSARLELTTNTSAAPVVIRLAGNAARASGDIRNPSIIFQSVGVNTCRDSVVRKFIYNLGDAPLRITSAEITTSPSGTAADPLAFTLVRPVIPPDFLIGPHDSTEVEIRFCPTEARAYYARLVLNNNTLKTPFVVELIGSGRTGGMSTPDSVRFTKTRVLTTRDSLLLNFIRNTNDGPLRVDSITITGADASSFTMLGPGTPFTIEGRGDTNISVRFNPFRRGLHQGTLTVHTPSGSRGVNLVGLATYPFLEIKPSDATSLSVRVNTTRRIRIDITNRDDESSDSARIEDALLRGSPAFTNVSAGPFPVTLQPGESVPIFVDFTPDQLCEHAVALDLRGEGVRGIYATADTVVNLAGMGVAPMIGSRRPEISFGLKPIGSSTDTTLDDFLGNLDFSDQITRCATETTIDSMVITGSGAASFSIIGPADPLAQRPIAAGAFQPLVIQFQPSGGGAQRAELLVYFDGTADSVHRIDLFGASSSLPVEYGPHAGMIAIDFGGVRVNEPRDSTFTITNISSAPITIDEISSTLPSRMEILSPAAPFTLAPEVPETVRVRFTPAALEEYEARVIIRSGSLADSSFSLLGVGVRDALRSESDTVDFGLRAPGTPVDTTILLFNVPTPEIPDARFLDSAVIDAVVMVSGEAFYEVLGHASSIVPDGQDSIILRFNPTGPFARREGLARIYYNSRVVNGSPLRDSLDIFLSGIVDGPGFDVRAELGTNLTGAPGNIVEIPLVLSGEVTEAAFDQMDIRLGFTRTLLKPLNVIPVQAGVAAVNPLPTDGSGRNGTSTFRLTTTGRFAPGIVARIACRVLLPDTLETTVRIDSIGVQDRPDISFEVDSVRFVLSEFCDAEGRLLRFDSLLTFASKPNPASRVTQFDYTLPAAVDAQLSIYNSAGDEVVRLADGAHAPGRYSVPFDASGFSSGTYYCVLTAGRFSRTLILRILE